MPYFSLLQTWKAEAGWRMGTIFLPNSSCHNSAPRIRVMAIALPPSNLAALYRFSRAIPPAGTMRSGSTHSSSSMRKLRQLRTSSGVGSRSLPSAFLGPMQRVLLIQ